MSTKAPTTHVQRQDLLDAESVHRALLLAEARDPALRRNPRFRMLRMDAYETYYKMMAGCSDGR